MSHPIGCCDQGVIEEVDISAGNRSIGVTQHGGDSRLRKPEVVGSRCEAVAQKVGRDVRQLGSIGKLC